MARKTAVFCVLVSTFSLGLCDRAMSQVPDSSAQTNTEAGRISVQSQPITDALSNQTITFTTFFSPTTSPIPGGSGNFSSSVLSNYGNGQVSFFANNSSGTLRGLYAVSLSGIVRVVADSLTIAPSTGGFAFSSFSNAAIEGQNVVFRAVSAAGTSAIYRSNGTSIVQILAPNGTIPVPGGNLSSSSFFALKIDNSQIYFYSVDAANSQGSINGYYRSQLTSSNNGTDLTNAVPLITKATATLPIGGGYDESQGNLILYDTFNLVANINGTLVKLLPGVSPLGGGTFSSINFGSSGGASTSVSISGSRFAFGASVTLPGGGSNTGVYVYENGVYRTIADKTTSTVPFGGTGNFVGFTPSAVFLNGNNVYFTATDSNNQTRNYIADFNTGSIISTFSISPSTSSIYVPGFERDAEAVINGGFLNGAFSIATVPGTPASRLMFYPLTPCRVVDTRSTATPSLASGVPVAFTVNSGGPTFNYGSQGGSTTGCGVPSDAQAVFFNFVSVGAAGSGFLQAWAFGSLIPTASTLNYANVAGLNIANGIVLPVCNPAATSCSKDLNVQANQSSTQLVVDVVGYFK
jgi:hypothetical protein